MTLYHGTRRPFYAGGLVLPRNVHNGPGTSAPLNPGRSQPADAGDWVYLTDDPNLAWVYAWHAPGRGRPRVLTVEPYDAVQPDPEHGHEAGAYRCDAARVVAVDLDPKVSEADARKGWVLS